MIVERLLLAAFAAVLVARQRSFERATTAGMARAFAERDREIHRWGVQLVRKVEKAWRQR